MFRSKMIRVFCVALAFSAGRGIALGQSETDPIRLIQRIEAQRKQIDEVWQEGLIITEIKYEGMVKRTEVEFSAAFKQPNLFRFQLKGRSPLLMVSDGQWLWLFREREGTYTQTAAPKQSPLFHNWIGLFIPLQMGDTSILLPPSGNVVQGFRLLGQESLETKSGGVLSCYVVEGEMSKETLGHYDHGRVRVWVGTDDLITWKIESTFVPGSSSAEREVTITLLTKSVRVNEALPDSLFIFTPPAGARQLSAGRGERR